MARQQNETPVAVWYFIAATFAGTLPNLLFPGVDAWVRIVFALIGVALIAAGIVRLRAEMGWGAKPEKDDPPSGSSPDA